MSAARRPPRLLLVTGMSGAGRSTVLDALEDMGWDTVDNLPADLLEKFVHGGPECRLAPAAVGRDSRRRGFDPRNLPDLVRSIDGVLLSTEPYRFTEAHVDALERQIGKPVRLVDGEMMSWYGSRAIAGLRYLRDLL